jgi:D-cysteine desulfhydrase
MKQPEKFNFADTPTPLEKIKFEGNSFLIKRDDLTGVELSGNKIRKLEYLIYQAEKEGADIIFTCGGVDSNHARATVIAAAKRGIKTHLFLWGKNKPDPYGNLFLCRFFGAEITFLNKSEYSEVNNIMFDERKRFLKKGKNIFVIPEGGSVTKGLWGYLNCYDELKSQYNLNLINGITVAAGTGGTAAGLLCGAIKNSFSTKIYAVNVLYPAGEIKRKILMLAEAFLAEYEIKGSLNEEQLIILDGYSEEGYKNISEDKIKVIRRFAQSTGIILDPAYTGKAFMAYYENFLTKSKGLKNIFLHTGGIFGVFSKKKAYLSS